MNEDRGLDVREVDDVLGTSKLSVQRILSNLSMTFSDLHLLRNIFCVDEMTCEFCFHTNGDILKKYEHGTLNKHHGYVLTFSTLRR